MNASACSKRYNDCMSNAQFFTAFGLPILVMLIGFYTQNASIRDFRAEFVAFLNQFRSEVNSRFLAMDQKITDLTGKVVDIDNHLTRVEERLRL
jgi:hypothetical protein